MVRDCYTLKAGKQRILRGLFVLLFAGIWAPSGAQTVIGTVGMMNVPTADMREAGTFDGGASFIQKELLYKKSYNTYLYYVDFTAFSWLEITIRETLLKTRKSRTDARVGFYQQDRSTSVRVRPLKEGKYWPAVVLGANDIYSDHGGSQYACLYGVASKHFPIASVGTVEATAGYAKPRKKGTTYDGVMGGIAFAPAFFPDMRIMGEYDTEGYNIGASAHMLRHLNVTCFTREFKGFNATVSYQYTIPY
ncbi:MAG: YjbH domain-containing protein [Prevotella sp.]|nr:YjbH domain-containing protein [Prevotella sp.]